MEWWQYLLTLLGSTAVISFIQFLISRHDNKKQKSDDTKSEIEAMRVEMRERFAQQKKEACKQEKDSIRIQMLFMMEFHSDNQNEIMTMAERYFKDLKGDWWMTSYFFKYLEENKIAKPEWFHCD